MESSPADDHVHQFVLELLHTGSMLNGVVVDLLEALPADAYPVSRRIHGGDGGIGSDG